MERRNSVTSLFSSGGFDFPSSAYASDFQDIPNEHAPMGYSPFSSGTAATLPDEFAGSSQQLTTPATPSKPTTTTAPSQFYATPSISATPFTIASPGTGPVTHSFPAESHAFSIAPPESAAEQARAKPIREQAQTNSTDADKDSSHANRPGDNPDHTENDNEESALMEVQKFLNTSDTAPDKDQESETQAAATTTTLDSIKALHPMHAGTKQEIGTFATPTPMQIPTASSIPIQTQMQMPLSAANHPQCSLGVRDDKTEGVSARRDFPISFPAPHPRTHSQSSATSSDSLEKVLILMKGLIPLIQVALAADRCSIYVHDSTRSELCTLFSAGPDVMHLRIPDTTGIAGSVYNSGRLVNIADVYSDPRFYSSVDQNTGYKTKSMLCAPVQLAAASRTAGVIQAINKRGGVAFSPADEQLLQHFVAVVAAFLERVQEDAGVLRGVGAKGKGFGAADDSGDDDESATQLTNRSVSEADDSHSQISGASGRERTRSLGNQEPRFETFHIDPNQKPRRPKKPVRQNPSETHVQTNQQKKYKSGQFPVFHFRTSKK